MQNIKSMIMGVYIYAFLRLMTSVEEESVEEIFSWTDFPDGLPGRIEESVGEIFPQTDFPDGLPGRIFLMDRVWVMSPGT